MLARQNPIDPSGRCLATNPPMSTVKVNTGSFGGAASFGSAWRLPRPGSPAAGAPLRDI